MTHEFNKKGVCTKCGCSRTAVQAFKFPCKPGTADTESAPLKRTSQASGMKPRSAKVFISHSHRDRAVATDLQRVLMKFGAQTFLDQDKIQVADVLPDRIQQGIEWCNTFLLIWSSSAAASDWVGKEWNAAYELRRKMFPTASTRHRFHPSLRILCMSIGKMLIRARRPIALRFRERFHPSDYRCFPRALACDAQCVWSWDSNLRP